MKLHDNEEKVNNIHFNYIFNIFLTQGTTEQVPT